jgi:hypothetical protein
VVAQGKVWWLFGKVWWLNWEGVVAQWEGVVAQLGRCGGSMGKVWWLNGSALDCCPAVPGSNPASPQPTADCQSPGGLPPGMALACELTSVKGDRGENYENTKKHIKKKKHCCP